MQLRHVYPVDTAGGCCFITRRHEVDELGIIDLDLDLESLGAWGRLCVSPTAVRAMNELLGWKIDQGAQTPAKQLKAAVDILNAENLALREALRTIVAAAIHAGVDPAELEPV